MCRPEESSGGSGAVAGGPPPPARTTPTTTNLAPHDHGPDDTMTSSASAALVRGPHPLVLHPRRRRPRSNENGVRGLARRWLPCLEEDGRTTQPRPSSSSLSSSPHSLSIRGGGGAGSFPAYRAGGLGFATATTTSRVVLLLLSVIVTVVMAVLLLILFHRGFRRSVQFWTKVAPLVVEYKFLEWRAASTTHSAPYLGSSFTPAATTTATTWRHSYHVRTAPKVAQIILALGGIYIKLGQVLSTVGQAIMPDEYVVALQPLQNGVPPRPIDEVRRIIEKSTGRSMSSLFVEFDPTPIGSASIAQVHRARLAPDSDTGRGQEVVVKVQYPEVAQQFNADLANLELVTRILAPDQLPMIRALRHRHQNELDFRLEASHLIECRNNLMKHWNHQNNNGQPLVTIPRVLNETGLCTRHVLVMEYLDGTPLAEVLEAEQVRLAKALRWLSPSVDTTSSASTSNEIDVHEARRQLTARLRKHYLSDSESNDSELGGTISLSNATQSGGNDGGGFGIVRVAKRHGRLLQALAPAGLRLLHLYANVRDRIEQVSVSIKRLARRIGPGGLTDDDSRRHPMLPSAMPRQRRLNLARALKTLIRVHGLQLLRDGVYNADPHPGNVLVLPDGRLGLLDYGMVGRLSDDDRRTVAQVVVALKRNERHTIADLYVRHGFRASFRNQPIRDKHVLHRFATFHLDKVDLSSIVTESGELLDLATLFRHTVVHSVPDWIAQARRLSGLLMGVTAEALRPVSLAHEWHDIAEHVLRQQRQQQQQQQHERPCPKASMSKAEDLDGF